MQYGNSYGNMPENIQRKKPIKSIPFLLFSNDAHCVLCQQKLSNEAKIRLTSFEEFVKEKAQKAETAAKESLESAIQNLPQVPNKRNF